MRAICINDDFEYEKIHFPLIRYIKKFPKEGEVYEITIRKCDMGYEGIVITNIDCGILPNGKPVAFQKNRFLILEDELEELIFTNQNKN